MRGPISIAVLTLLATASDGRAGDERAAPLGPTPKEGNWRRVAPPLIAHGGGHTMTVLPSGGVLVVGGEHPKWEPEPASAEVWDPARDRWDLIPGLDARPTSHTASLLPDGRVAVAGGTGGGPSEACRQLRVFSPRTSRFERARPLPTPRVGHAAVVLSDGRLLLAGGFPCDSKGQVIAVPIPAIEIWDPKRDEWTAAGQLPAGQTATSAYRLHDGRVLLLAERKRNTCLWSPKPAGGACENGPALDGPYRGGAQLADGTVAALVDGAASSKLVEILDGDRWVQKLESRELGRTVSAMSAVRLGGDRLFVVPDILVDVRKQTVAWTPPLPWSMLGARVAALRNGEVLFVGGSRPSDGGRALLWDPVGQPAGRFTALPAGPANDWELVAPLRDGRLLYRQRNYPTRGPNRVMVWDPRAGRATETAPMHDYRALFAAVVTGQGEVIVIGGEDLNRARHRRLLSSTPEPDPSTLSSVERWSPATGRWTQLAPLPEPRESADAVVLGDGRILVVGGAYTMFESGPGGVQQGMGHVAGDSFIYDPSRNSWRRGPSLGRHGVSHLLALPDGRVLGIGTVCGVIGGALERWEPTPCPAESHAGAAVLEGGGVLVAGGEGKTQDVPLDSAEFRDPKSGLWRRVRPMAVGRYNASVVALPGGGALVAGGETRGIEVWDAEPDRWRVNTEVDGALRSLVKIPEGVLVDVSGAGDSRLWLWKDARGRR